MTPFTAELRRAMALQGVTCAALAARIGVPASTVRSWRSTQLPRQEYAVALAEALDCRSLATIALRARTLPCRLCGATSVRAKDRSVYCTPRCRTTAHARRQRGRSQKASAAALRFARSRLALHAERVAVSAARRIAAPARRPTAEGGMKALPQPRPVLGPIEQALVAMLREAARERSRRRGTLRIMEGGTNR